VAIRRRTFGNPGTQVSHLGDGNAGTPRPPLTEDEVASIDSFVATKMSRTHVPGAAVGIYSRGEVLLAKGYGLANIQLNVPVSPETL
jgi:CubicO group peptidase (beta-lactamase class C family)